MTRISLKSSRLIGPAIATALALTVAATQTAPLQAQSARITETKSTIRLSVAQGKSITLPSNASDIFIAEQRIADVQIRSTNKLYVFGKTAGVTSFYATNSAGKIIYSAQIHVGTDIRSIDQMLSLAMPDANIAVSTSNDFVLLTGTIQNPSDAEEAERLVQAFVGDETTVVSRLKTATPLQVNLKVRFAEVSRTLAKEINGNVATRDTTGGFLFGTNTGRNFVDITGGLNNPVQVATGGLPVLDASSIFGLPAGSIALPFSAEQGSFVSNSGVVLPIPNDPTAFGFNRAGGTNVISAAGRLFGLDIATALDVSERLGLATSLATPNLTTVSGETANFLAGGRFPIPVAQGLGDISVQFQNFGISLSYTPTVLSNGRISLRVKPSVSDISQAGAVVLNGFSIPSITTREAETTVELGSGESFMIAGLLQNNYGTTLTKTPGLGDIPILGNLFKSDSFTKNETELMIVVTPYLVKPVSDNEIVLPTDGFKGANDIERLLLNRTHSKGGEDRPKPGVQDEVRSGPAIGSLIKPEPVKRSKRKSKTNPKTASAAPGFSF